jgi:hypothetical protein
MNIESESTTFSRGKRKRPFFTSYCHVAQDCNLSIEARGLLFYYLSFPEDWKHHFEKVSSENQIGKDKLQRLNKELIKAGYMISWQEKKKNGVWGSHHYEIFDDKEEAAERLKELESEKKYNDILSGEKQEKPSHIESEPLPCFPAAGKSGYILNNKDNKKEISKDIQKDSVTASSFPSSEKFSETKNPSLSSPSPSPFLSPSSLHSSPSLIFSPTTPTHSGLGSKEGSLKEGKEPAIIKKRTEPRRSTTCVISEKDREQLEADFGKELLEQTIAKMEESLIIRAHPGYGCYQGWNLAIRKAFRENWYRPVATSRSWSPQTANQGSCTSNQQYAQMGLKKFVDKTTDGWSVSISSVAVGIYKGQAGYDFRFDDPEFKTKLDTILKRLKWS